LACLAAGCGGGADNPAERAAAPGTADSGSATAASRPADAPPPSAKADSPTPQPSEKPMARQAEGDESQAAALPRGPRTLADLMGDAPDAVSAWVPDLPRVEVDEVRAAAAGVHKLSGLRLLLYTDLPVDDEIGALPAAFEQAFPEWCRYFGVDPSQHADWQMTGFLIGDKSRFEKLGLLPEDLPPFEHGFSRNFEFWLYEQPSAYYRRHLVLHEGTHGFMNTLLRSCGPPWYMEGVAELLATHHWKDGVLTMGYMPQDRDEVPMWGRIKIINNDYAAQRAQQLDRVLDYQPAQYSHTEPYAWCWAAAALLDRHPTYRERFREMRRFVVEPGFNGRFRELIGPDWQDLCEQWQVFVAGLEYGYDVPAAAIRRAPGEPLPAEGARVSVDAACGWQSGGVRLEAGRAYRISAQGRYQVADTPQVWWCEPGGVSIRYYQGRPLGMLLAAVAVDTPGKDEISNLIQPVAVGLETTLTPDRSGTLYLRINDSAAELSDNAGALTVAIKPLP
jgi:hypothetical protein